MMTSLRQRFSQIPIRARLTIWFVFIMGATLVTLSLYLSFQFLGSLSSSIDRGLQITARQIFISLENESGDLAFPAADSATVSQISQTGLAMRLVDVSGRVLDQRGIPGEQPAWGPLQFGFYTSSRPADDTRWRTLTEPVQDAQGVLKGWLQVSQPLDILTNTEQDVRDQLALIIPILLVVLGAGGYFLSLRALRPIDQITRTAASISASDLSRRIDFSGPRDEVGRLAATFDAMLARLQSAFERERRFSADAAHELRTPLSVLRGKLDVTLGRKRSPEEYDATLRDLNLQVGRLIALSDDLLMLSRLEQRMLEGELSVVNLTDVIESILEQYEHVASEQGIEVSNQLPRTLMVEGYSDALLRLFLNLVDNAFKYTPEGGRIEVRAGLGESAPWVELFNSVFESADIQEERLFERFYRADPSRSRRSGGAGLGLSIAKEIVDAHDWRISVRREPHQEIVFRIEMAGKRSQ